MTIAYLNPSPDAPGHVCVRDENGQRLDTFSGPRPIVVAHYQRGYDVRDEHGKRIDLHDVVKSDAHGGSLGLTYDWCGQRWMRKNQ